MNPTPLHAFRIPETLYRAALQLARDRGTNLTAVIVQLLYDWVGPAAVEPPSGRPQTS